MILLLFYRHFFVLRAMWCILPIVVMPWPNTLVVFQWLFRCKQVMAWFQSKLSHQGPRLGNLSWPWYPFPERQVTKNSYSSAISASTEIIHKLRLQTWQNNACCKTLINDLTFRMQVTSHSLLKLLHLVLWPQASSLILFRLLHLEPCPQLTRLRCHPDMKTEAIQRWQTTRYE